MNWPAQVLTVLALSVLGVASGSTTDESATQAALGKAAPENISDLRAIQDRVTGVIDNAMRATVGLQVGVAQASGVVVSTDGYILTAAHVIGRPGRTVRILFADGTTAQGKTLGVNPGVDGGLVQITDPGPWPFAELASAEASPRPGDWCVAIGHPGGFQSGRTPPVRVGRVIDYEPAVIRTDCVISMGDSGGPLFDMKGRVIGIHSRIAEAASMNFHVPADTYRNAWDELKAGEVVPRHVASRFLSRLDTNGDGKLNRDEIPDGFYRQVFDRMIGQLELDPAKTYAVDELRKSLGLNASNNFDPRDLPMPTRTGRPNESLQPDRFGHGRAVRSAFGEVISAIRASTVRVRCQSEDVALGTIISSDGAILTKASQITDLDHMICVTNKGREFTARLLGVDPTYDLALLKIDATDLTAVSWEREFDVRLGAWLASPGPAPQPAAVGVVSVGVRAVGRGEPVLGILIEDRESGAYIRQVMPRSGAAAAGMREGDKVTCISGERVRSLAELKMAVRKHRIGDTVTAIIERDDAEQEFAVRLSSPEDSFTDNPVRVSGAMSYRRDDFPAVLQHDTVLRPTDCGGPLVDLAGRVVGLNIARADRTASYALPSTTVLSVLETLRYSGIR